MYANKKNLAALFGVTTQTVQRRVKGIEKLIGDRYNQYAILDNLVSVAVYADYEKYHKCLEDKLTKKYVPPFDMEWWDVTKRMRYSQREVYRTHSIALRKLEIPENWQ